MIKCYKRHIKLCRLLKGHTRLPELSHSFQSVSPFSCTRRFFLTSQIAYKIKTLYIFLKIYLLWFCKDSQKKKNIFFYSITLKISYNWVTNVWNSAHRMLAVSIYTNTSKMTKICFWCYAYSEWPIYKKKYVKPSEYIICSEYFSTTGEIIISYTKSY